MNQPLSCAVAWVMRGTWTKVSEAETVLRSEDHTQKLTDKRAILVTLIWKVWKIASFLFLFLPYIFFHTCLHFPHPFVSFIFTKTVCVTRNKNGLGSSLLVKLRQHFILFYSYVFDCFAYMYVCISRMCLMLSDVRWGCYIPGTNCYESPFGLWETKWVFHKSYPGLKCRAIFFHLRERDSLCLSFYVHPFFL